MTYNKTKQKSQGKDNYEMTDNPIILAQPNSPHTYPVSSYRLYMSKVTKIDDFFQQPNPFFKHKIDFWYKSQPVGVGIIESFFLPDFRICRVKLNLH